jgi:hypothetical protein
MVTSRKLPLLVKYDEDAVKCEIVATSNVGDLSSFTRKTMA